MNISPWAKFGTSVVLKMATIAIASSAYTLPVTSPERTPCCRNSQISLKFIAGPCSGLLGLVGPEAAVGPGHRGHRRAVELQVDGRLLARVVDRRQLDR